MTSADQFMSFRVAPNRHVHGFQKHSHQFSLRTTKIQIEISDAIISRHLQPFKRIAVQYAAGAAIVSGDSEPMLIVDSKSYLLAT